MKKSGKSSVRGIVALITVCALLLGMGAYAAAVYSPTVVQQSGSALAQAETGRTKDLYVPGQSGNADARSMGTASFANRPTVIGAEENGGRWSVVTFGSGRFGGTRLWLFNNAAIISGSDALPALQETQPEKVSASDAVTEKVSASDAVCLDGLLSVESAPALLAEGDTDISFAVEQSYADDVEDKPTSYGKVTLETYGSRITPAGGSSAVQQYNTTAAADGGTIASGAQMSNLKILSYDRKYPIKSVQVFVNGEDATSEVGTFFSKTTDDHGRAKWTYNFNSGFKFADGSDVTFKIVYGSWEKYTLSQRYDDSIPADERPSAYGSIYVLTSSGTMSDGVTNTNNVTLTSSEQSETGHIEPNLKINYIRVTPPTNSHYYIKSVKVLVDGVDVTDTAISSASRPEGGEWKLTFRTDYVISAGSTLQVEAVYDNWKTYKLKQGYDGSIVPEPETFGKVTLATTQAAIVTEGSTNTAYSDSIEKTQASGWGYIKPNAELNYVRVEPDGNCSVRSVSIYIDGVDVTDEAIDLNRAATVKPSTGTWVLYFKSGYKLPAGSSLVVDVKYGGWESYEIRQGYDDSVDPAPETFGEVIVAAQHPAFVYEGVSGLAYDAKIDKTQASGTGLIKPDTTMNYVRATPTGNYSVRSLKVFVDGVDVTEEAINWNAAATVRPSTGTWILYFNSNFVIADGSVLEVEATYGGWESYEIRQGYDSSVDPAPDTFGEVIVAASQPSFIPKSGTGLVNDAKIDKTQASDTGIIKPDTKLNYVKATPMGNYSVRSLKVFVDGVDVTEEAINWNAAATVRPSTGEWILYFNSNFVIADGSVLEVEATYGGWESYEIRQGYDDSVDPVPETFGEVIVAASQPSFISEGGTGLAYDATITPDKASGTGIIKPDSKLNYVKATPTGNHSVRSLKVFVDGVDVTEEAINWNAAATVTPSTGAWILYFNSNFVIADGSVLEVEATYGGWQRYEIRQKYADSVDPKPDRLGTLVVAASQPSFISEGGTGLAYDATITPDEASETGIIKPDTKMNYIRVEPTGVYSVRSVKVFVDGEDVTDEAINWNAAATATPSTGAWILYFNSNYIVSDGSILEVEAEYGGWESYEIRQKYSESVDPTPDKLGTLIVAASRPAFVVEGGTGLAYDATITPDEVSETGLIKPDSPMNYVRAEPTGVYSVRSVKVFVDGEDVTDEAINWNAAATATPSTGAWILYFNANYVIADGSVLEVEAEYGGWESYEIRQSYSDSIDPEPDKLGTLIVAASRPAFVAEGGTGLAYDATITPDEASETGLIKPDSPMNYVRAEPTGVYSVRSVKVFVDGEDVTDEAINWNAAATQTPSSGAWILYFNANYVIADGSVLEVEAEYGDWESYEIRQKYASYITPAPEKLGTVVFAAGRPAFVVEGGTGLAYDATITPDEASETGLIKPDSPMNYIRVTPPSIYSVRKVKVFVDGEDVTDEAINWNAAATQTPSSGAWILYFNANYIVPDGSTVEVEAEYGDWESYEIRQKYASYITPAPDRLGTVVLAASRPAFVLEGGTGLAYDATINPDEASETGLIKPDSPMNYIRVTPPSVYSVRKVKVFVDGEDVTDEAINWNAAATQTPSSGAWILYFNANYIVPDGSIIEVEAEYGDWESYEIRQKYASYITPAPEKLGTVVFAAGRPAFVLEGGTGLAYDATINPDEASETGLIKPDSPMNYIRVTPPSVYSVRKVKVFIDGEDVTDEAINWNAAATQTPSSGAWILYFNANYTVPDGSAVEVEAEYGDWEGYEIRQSYSDSVDPKPGSLGTVILAAGRPAFVLEGGTGLAYDATIKTNEASKTGLLKPDSPMNYIRVTPPSVYSVRTVKVFVDGEEVTDEAINWEAAATQTPSSGAWILYFKANYIVPDGSTIEVEVEYGSWETYEIVQGYTDSVEPVPETYGKVILAAGRPAFVLEGGTGLAYDATITASEASETGYVRPESRMNYIRVEPPTGYSVVGLDVYIDGVLKDDAINRDAAATQTPDSGVWILYFKPNYILADSSTIKVEATYGEWCDFTLVQKFADSVDPKPTTLGKVSVNANTPAFKLGNGLAYSATLESDKSTYEGNLRPDRKLVDIRIEPPVNSSVVSVDVYVDGVLDETAIDYSHTGTLTPTSGNWRVYFRPDFTAPVSSELDVIVTYGDWHTITLKQENLLGGAVGKVTATGDRYNAFCTETTRAASFEINGTASGSRQLHPDAQLKTVVIKAPNGLTILEAKATITKNSVTTEWKNGRKNVLTLNDDGTVTIVPTVADGDVTIDVKYGSRMYVKSNVTDVVTVDSTKAGADFAKLCDLTAAEKTFGITVKDGWKLDSVYYGTTESAQNTVLTAQGSDYKISSVASDIYLLVNVVRDDRALSARMDGTGEASIVYGSVTTPLTGTAQVIDDAVQIDSKVTFEIAAGADTNILDVKLNGTSLGSVREFTMPETDSEIVVYTELVKVDKASIKAVLTGSGEAEAAYGNDVITLEAAEKIVAADLATGIYEVTFRPVPGSKIESVTLNGTELGRKSGEENVYLVPVAGEDVLVTVETSKIAQYKILAKANISDTASIDGTNLTTDYSEIVSVYENEDGSFVLTCNDAYEITKVRCGDTPDSLVQITAQDGKFTISALTADKYVDVTLAKKPIITIKRTGDGVVYTNGGSEDISGTSYTVAVGSNHDFSFIPYDGSQLVKVIFTFDGEESITVYDSANGISSSITTRGALNTDDEFVHMIANLTEDCTVEAVFTNLPEYTLHVIKKGEGEGTFTYEGTSHKDSFDVTVKHGSAPELTIKAKGGSKIVSVMVGDSEETAVKVDFSGSVLTLPEVTKDIYVIAEFEKIPSGGGPQTGDTVIAGTVTNLFIISALVCVYCVFRRRKSEETA